MKAILAFISAICSLAAVATTYNWVGGKSTIWNLTDANWTTAGVQGNCAFVAGGDAIFDLNDSLSLKFGAQVRPETVSATVAANKTLTFDFTNSGNQFFSTTTTIEKKGTGTVYFYRPNVSSYGTGDFPADSILDIQKGVVIISSRNKGGLCAPKNIVLHSGTTL